MNLIHTLMNHNFLANAMEFINLKICHTTSLMLEDKILIYYSETEIFMDLPFG